jgi:hypothetical protein
VSKTLLIHHWDADGMCSAKILLEHFTRRIHSNMTPILGNYFLTEDEMDFAREFDTVIIADLALPEKNIKEIAKNAEVLIFDHHIQPHLDVKLHHNPVSKGATPQEYPSTSYVLNRYLQGSVDLYVLLGAVGDREAKLKENPLFWPFVETYLETSGLHFSDLLQMVHLLDSSYRVGDKTSVEEAPYLLMQNPGPTYILHQKKWNQNVIDVDTEVRKILSVAPRVLDGVLVKYMHTSYNIISQITRRIAWDEEKDTIVVNTGHQEGMIQLYTRSTDTDLTPVIQLLKMKGYYAGGKKDVLGVILPVGQEKRLLSQIIHYLNTQ